MTSLAQAIRSFQRGALSQPEFFAQVDQSLAAGSASRSELLEVLEEEQARLLLPADVYAELVRRIEHRAVSRQSLNGDETPMQTTRNDRFTTPTESPGLRAGNAQPEPDVERMKGVGDTLNGRFVLEECIGFGGMGTVYRALDLRKLEASDRKPYIAIKVLNVQFRGHPKSLIALQREAKKAQALAHPNIVTVYDFDRDGNMVYLTMEYLSGKPLSRTVRAPDFKGMPYAQALHIVNGIARALAYAHERGFVHCDLKPANVFVTDSGEVKVIDFGIARVFQKPQEEVEATVFDPGSLGGMTPAYASPEMIDRRTPDPRDDIYALGCITYELLTGRHPFGRLPANQARSAGMKPERPKNLGLRQWRALRQALSFEREARTPTVARFLHELGEERRSHMPLGLAAGFLLFAVLAAAGVGYYMQRGGEGIAHDNAQPAAPPVAEAAPPPPAAAAPAPPAAPTPALAMAAVEPVLAQVPCAALSGSLKDGVLQVQGYVGKDFGAAQLKSRLSALPGAKEVKLDVDEISKEKCAPVSTLAPYWASNRLSAHPAAIHTKPPNTPLLGGDPLVVEISTPAYDSYVYVDYFAMDGSVVHMVPSERARAHQAPPSYTATIGSNGNWVVAPPFGTELVTLVVVPERLFSELRPETEDAGAYLRALDESLRRLKAKAGADRIAADFVQINTRAKK